MLVDNELAKDRPRDKIPEVFELSKCNGLDLFEVTVDELQHHFSTGTLTSVQYTTFCLENIRKVGTLRALLFFMLRGIPILTCECADKSISGSCYRD